MAIYGFDYYDESYYGGPDYALQFYAEPFTATSGAISGTFNGISNYGSITLNWNNPSGNWSNLIIVRNTYGFPVTPYDGVQVLFANNGTSPVSFIDSIGLVPGTFYYYSFFVFNLTQYSWSNAGTAIGLSVKDYGNTKKLYDYLPEVYKISQPYSATSDWDNPQLQSFLSNFGFQLDYDQTLSSLLVNRYDTQKVSGILIPTMLNQFGQKYEPAIGLQQNRVILRDAVTLTKQRGSLKGLIGFLEDFTGWAIADPDTALPNPPVEGVQVGHNMMLDYNDSSFEEGIGHWFSADGLTQVEQLPTLTILSVSITSNVVTLTTNNNGGIFDVGDGIIISGLPMPLLNSSTPWVLTASTTNTLSFAVTSPDVSSTSGFNAATNSYGIVSSYPYPWSEPTSPILFPNKKKALITLDPMYATGTNTMTVYCGAQDPINMGIPVIAGSSYTFSIYAAKGLSTARNVTVSIKWFNRLGVLISTSTGSSVSNNTALFTSSVRPYVTGVAPVGAYYAAPGISVASVPGYTPSYEHHYFDAAQFELGTSPSNFDEARQLHITMRANRINELTNPNFAVSTSPWSFSGGAATAVINTTIEQPNIATYTVTNTSLTTNVATVTVSTPHTLQVGSAVYLTNMFGSGVTSANYNGVRTITAVTLYTFSFAVTASNQASIQTTGSAYQQGHAMQITASNSSTVVVSSWDGSTTSEMCNVYYPGTSYTFSVYVQSSNPSETAVLKINWYDSTHTLISSTVSNPVTVKNSDWCRPYITGTAPLTAGYATVEIDWSTSSSGGTHILYLDQALFESVGFLENYFDGSGGNVGLTTDFLWEGNAANAARSHFYKNKQAVFARLYTGVLASQITLGSTAAIYIGQPQT